MASMRSRGNLSQHRLCMDHGELPRTRSISAMTLASVSPSQCMLVYLEQPDGYREPPGEDCCGACASIHLIRLCTTSRYTTVTLPAPLSQLSFCYLPQGFESPSAFCEDVSRKHTSRMLFRLRAIIIVVRSCKHAG
jgi:hypothetical protein